MRIKFITINILHGGTVWESLLSFIRQEQPDILALQEVYNGYGEKFEKRYRTISEFQKEFAHFLPYHSFGATVVDTACDVPWGNAVFSRFPIKSSKTIFFDRPFMHYNFTLDPDPYNVAEGMQEAQIEINGKNAFILSWHGVWDTHGNDTERRNFMLDIIVRELSGKTPIILAGDTNLLPTTDFVKKLKEKLFLKSVFENELVSTFNMGRKNEKKVGYSTSPVDMIFVSDEFEVLEKHMPPVDVSDHYPLVATLNF